MLTAALIGVFGKGLVSAGLAGLAISYANQFTGILSQIVDMFSSLEAELNSSMFIM